MKVELEIQEDKYRSWSEIARALGTTPEAAMERALSALAREKVAKAAGALADLREVLPTGGIL